MEEKYRNKSMVDVAVLILEENEELLPMDFYELFKRVSEALELTEEQKEERISPFYTNITLDGRIHCVGDNEWNLRKNLKSTDIAHDLSAVYKEIDDETLLNRDDEDDGEEISSDEENEEEEEYSTEDIDSEY